MTPRAAAKRAADTPPGDPGTVFSRMCALGRAVAASPRWAAKTLLVTAAARTQPWLDTSIEYGWKCVRDTDGTVRDVRTSVIRLAARCSSWTATALFLRDELAAAPEGEEQALADRQMWKFELDGAAAMDADDDCAAGPAECDRVEYMTAGGIWLCKFVTSAMDDQDVVERVFDMSRRAEYFLSMYPEARSACYVIENGHGCQALWEDVEEMRAAARRHRAHGHARAECDRHYHRGQPVVAR